MSYLIGSGWWVLWYGLLWLALVPFIVTTAALARATPNETVLAMETAFGISALSVVVLMLNRWAAQLTCVGSAAVLLAFCLHAAWRFRHR